ncbi:MAG TPA: carboxyl transferase domain-containing protein [Dehalococcoidia bacterium]|nr:carboxyl transferase domain-containing protein [Dehalococcoidia bacterium]
MTNWDPELEELRLKRALSRRMGGREGIERQHSQGRLTVRERMDLLLDPGTFEELFTAFGESQYDEEGRLTAFRPGNVIAGYGKIDGRSVAVRGDDFTIRGGASDSAAAGKRSIEQMAGGQRIPLVLLLEGAGGSISTVAQDYRVEGAPERAGPQLHRVQDLEGNLVALGPSGVPGSINVPRDWDGSNIVPMAAKNDIATVLARGNLLAQVPVVAAVLGSCAGWIAIAAVESHFSVMLKDTSELFVGGPPLIKQAMGIDISKQELGNHKVHAQLTGVVNNVAESEEDAFQQIRRFLSYLPSNVWQLPPRQTPSDDPNRREESLATAIPRDRRLTYDIRRIIRAVVDKDSAFEISPLFGRSLVTMFARIDGFPVAVIANDCRQDGGAQTATACQKFERFVDLADTFHLPIVYLCDVPGFNIGPESEREGTLRWALRANMAVREATVPYCTVLLRRFYGVAQGGSKRGGNGFNIRYAWPSAESGSIPAAGGVAAAYRRLLQEDPEAGEKLRVQLEERLNRMASVMRRTNLADEIIDPRDTRPALVDFVRRSQAVNATQLGPKLRVGMRP